MPRLRIVFFMVVLLNLLSLASAQSDQFELFGGYSLERIATACGLNYRCGSPTLGPAINMSGFTTSLTGFVYRSFGITAQFTGNRTGNGGLSGSSFFRSGYQFGPAYAVRWRRTSTFVHALFGGVTQRGSADESLSYTKFLWSLGGGVDFRVARQLFIRPVQLDYERQSVPVVDDNGPEPVAPIRVNGLRYSAGIVFRF
jgi:hypothetical protein